MATNTNLGRDTLQKWTLVLAVRRQRINAIPYLGDHTASCIMHPVGDILEKGASSDRRDPGVGIHVELLEILHVDDHSGGVCATETCTE